MAYKSTGKAAKSASGASMSKYDVEVEARLQALEAAVADLKNHDHPHSHGGHDGNDCGDTAALIARLNEIDAITAGCPKDVDGVRRLKV